jgi:hypothetical protein
METDLERRRARAQYSVTGAPNYQDHATLNNKERAVAVKKAEVERGEVAVAALEKKTTVWRDTLLKSAAGGAVSAGEAPRRSAKGQRANWKSGRICGDSCSGPTVYDYVKGIPMDDRWRTASVFCEVCMLGMTNRGFHVALPWYGGCAKLYRQMIK